MALTITDNSVRQINAALLSLEKKIGETNSEKAQDKQVVQMELKNIQYNFMAPLYQSGNSVSINTTGTWEGNARSATNAEHASTADSATTATSATNATNANISKTLDTVDGDKLQIGNGTAVNITNAVHAVQADNVEHANTADSATTATNATNATNANISKTLDTVNGDKLQIGNGTAQNITNAKHAATAEHAITADNGVPTYSTSDAGKRLSVNNNGTGTEWVKPQTIKFVDYKTGNLTFSSTTDQKKIELSSFGPEVTENNVLSFMVIYWAGVHIIAQADWAKSQGTGSSGLACALHSLNAGTGYAVIRCVYLA